MSRRGRKSEVGFESDSFLDIIANIVGILIILIVVAGVRVSKAPVISSKLQSADPESAVAENIAPASSAANDALQQGPSSTQADEAAEDVPVELTGEEPAAGDELQVEGEPATPRVAPVVAPKPSPALIARIKNLEHELGDIERNAEETAWRTAELARKQAEQSRGVLALADAVASKDRELEQSQRQLAKLQSELDAQQGKLVTLGVQLERAKREKDPVKEITHRITPISREVSGSEIHFQLARNRVAYVPIEELVERLKPQIERKKEWLAKHRRHEGRIGPVLGFTMHYVVERQSMSVFQELQSGSGMLRIVLSKWELQPERDLATESPDEAIRMGSAFIRQLMAADLDSTVTFWVYPDSFEAYRALQKFAHDQGFTVAARPLPFDVPITGSPNGTRSAAQ